MNLFWLSKIAKKNKRRINDNHISKMPLEATQSLYDALRVAGVKLDPSIHYKPCNMRHPIVRWSACSRMHMRIAQTFDVVELFAEYHERLHANDGFIHKTVQDGHPEKLKHLIETSDLPNSLPDTGEAPDAAAVRDWDNKLTDSIFKKYKDPTNPANLTPTGRLSKRTHKRPEELVLATVDLPPGCKCIPLAMDKEFHVYDDQGRLRGIQSYVNYYFHDKLMGNSPLHNMRTYAGSSEWPAPFDSLKQQFEQQARNLLEQPVEQPVKQQ